VSSLRAPHDWGSGEDFLCLLGFDSVPESKMKDVAVVPFEFARAPAGHG